MSMVLIKAEADSHLYKTPPKGLADHPIAAGGTTVGMMTADAPRYPQQESTGNQGLEQDLHGMGLQFEKTHGSYGGKENSFLVYGPTREQMYRLAHKHGQESFIYSQDGKNELTYSNGPNAGKYHPGLPLMRFSQEAPDDYYTHIPGRGYLTLHFDLDKLKDSPVKYTMPAAQKVPEAMTKAEIAAILARNLRKALEPKKEQWAGSYEWHEGHTSHHHRSPGGGVLLTGDEARKLFPLAKADYGEAPTADEPGHATNDQAAKAGVSTYAKFAQPYGTVNKGQSSNLKFYPMEGQKVGADKLVKDHGYQVYYAGGKHGKADLAGKNYNTKHLMIWDPSADSGASFGHQDYTDNWRKLHELSHALTYPQLNETYGEGRRMGALGKQRTAREAKRAVHWEWLAAHKQRELGKQIGINIPDEDFNRELNTVMHDAVHRAVTGKFTEPSEEGFTPHPHKVPLETALGMVDEHARQMGLQSDHDVIRKALAETLKNVLKKYGF